MSLLTPGSEDLGQRMIRIAWFVSPRILPETLLGFDGMNTNITEDQSPYCVEMGRLAVRGRTPTLA